MALGPWALFADPGVGAGPARGQQHAGTLSQQLLFSAQPCLPSLPEDSELPVTVTGQNRAWMGTFQSC